MNPVRNFALQCGGNGISNGVKEMALLSWSGGKESAFALYETQKSARYEIAALLTTVTETYNRVSMHGVREVLLKQQADSLGYFLESVVIPKEASLGKYESAMHEVLAKYRSKGVTAVIFGDIFLEDVRKQREKNLSKVGMEAVFPLWRNDTRKHAFDFIKLGFKTVVTCVDSNFLNKRFVGRVFDEEFLSELPSDIDPCGENGEFHSFVYDGPIFQNPIPHKLGEICSRDNRFYYCDLLPI